MASLYVQKPDKYVYGEDFDLFFRQFKTFSKNVKCEAADVYNLLLGFLDRKSYQLVETIVFTETEKTQITADINNALPKLKIALTPPDRMPAKIELKFRKQKLNESLADFGFAIQNLGVTAFGTDALSNGQVIDAFCMGVRNPEVSAKLLNHTFTTLSEAITFAQTKESSETIKQYVIKNRTCDVDVQLGVGDIPVMQTEQEGYGDYTEANTAAEVSDRMTRSSQNATQSSSPAYREQHHQNTGQTASPRQLELGYSLHMMESFVETITRTPRLRGTEQ